MDFLWRAWSEEFAWKVSLHRRVCSQRTTEPASNRIWYAPHVSHERPSTQSLQGNHETDDAGKWFDWLVVRLGFEGPTGWNWTSHVWGLGTVSPPSVPSLLHQGPDMLGSVKVRPVQFGALPASKQLLTKPRSRPKIEPNFEALSWLFLKEKATNSYEPGGLVNSLVSGTPKIFVNPLCLDMDVVKTLSI